MPSPRPPATATSSPRSARLAGRLLAGYLRLVARTARIGPFTRQNAVLAFWHEYNLALFVAARARRGDLRYASFSTRTSRGTVISTIFRSLARSRDQVVILPLPEEGDRVAARTLATQLGELGRAGYSPVVTPDGPWGPYRVAKPGALIVARHAGLPILPLAVRARPAIRLAGRWDRQVLPLPFARLTIVVGEPIAVGARQPLRPLLPVLQTALDQVAASSDDRAPGPQPAPLP